MAAEFTDANFQSTVLESDKPVLVDFWAPWCGPCKMVGPIVEKLANEMTDVVIGKLNVDDNPGIAQKYEIMSIPTMLLIKDGEVVAKTMGFMPEPKLREFIAQAVAFAQHFRKLPQPRIAGYATSSGALKLLHNCPLSALIWQDFLTRGPYEFYFGGSPCCCVVFSANAGSAFLSEVQLINDDGSLGEVVTAHCPNSGSMKTLNNPGLEAWVRHDPSPKRKLKYTLVLLATPSGGLAVVDTMQPNRVVYDGVVAGLVPELSGYGRVRREVAVHCEAMGDETAL